MVTSRGFATREMAKDSLVRLAERQQQEIEFLRGMLSVREARNAALQREVCRLSVQDGQNQAS